MKKIALFFLQFLGYLWYFCLFLIIIPVLTLIISRSIDWLILDHLLQLRFSWGAFSTYVYFLLKIFGSGVIVCGFLLIYSAWDVLFKESQAFPFTVIYHQHLNPKKLATSGPYSWVRNPMLLGYFFFLCGLGFLWRSFFMIVWVAPLVCVSLLEYTFLTEEKSLLRWFGKDYEKYKKNTPALFPDLKKFLKSRPKRKASKKVRKK